MNIKKEFDTKIKNEILDVLGMNNIHKVPTISKIMINSGVSDAVSNSESIDIVEKVITAISGRKPVRTKAKISVSNFHIRKGMYIGVKVTLRGDIMWDFYERLVSIVIPRIRDFRGLARNSFDGSGNYTIGVKDHTIFPEVAQLYIDKVKSLHITIMTTADKDSDATVLLERLNFPLVKI